MKKAKRIYCIEGYWDYGKREVEPTVEPILALLQQWGQWNYMRRDCVTLPEFQFYLKNEWSRCQAGSILYIASHAYPTGFTLSENEHVELNQLAAWLEGIEGRADNCLVHFGGCEIMSAGEGEIRKFMERTWAMGVSGYRVEGDWANLDRPTLALELMLFSAIAEEGIDLANGKQYGKLVRIRESLQQRFADCEFELYHRLEEQGG